MWPWTSTVRSTFKLPSVGVLFKAPNYCLFFFLSSNDSFKIIFFYNLLTCSGGKNGNPATETAPPAGLVEDQATLAACPAPSLRTRLSCASASDTSYIRPAGHTVNGTGALLHVISQFIVKNNFGTIILK